MAEEKPYEPSSKKLKKAAEDGKLPKSKLIPWSIAAIIIILRVNSIVPHELPESSLVAGQPLLDCSNCMSFASGAAENQLASGLTWMVVTLGMAGAASSIASLLQTKAALTKNALTIKFESLSPVSGFTRLGSELVKLHWYLIAVFALLIDTVYWTMRAVLRLPELIGAETEVIWYFSRSLVFQSLWSFLILISVFGIFELLWAHRNFKRQFGLTHQEMKEEAKEDAGDPHLRAERRSLQESLALENLPQRIKQSRVIIAARRDSDD